MTSKEVILESLKEKKTDWAKLGIRNIGLFGSYIRNKQTPESDIDLLLDFEPDRETFDNLMEVCDLLQELFKGEKIEVLTVNGLSKYIGPAILNEVQYV